MLSVPQHCLEYQGLILLNISAKHLRADASGCLQGREDSPRGQLSGGFTAPSVEEP
jgi:hypothetical protein